MRAGFGTETDSNRDTFGFFDRASVSGYCYHAPKRGNGRARVFHHDDVLPTHRSITILEVYMRFNQKIGILLLAAFLLLYGLMLVLSLTFQGSHIVLGGLAIASAIFILIDR
jgi:hypothetical protein